MSGTDLTAVITGIKLYADKGTSVAGETDAEAGNLPNELHRSGPNIYLAKRVSKGKFLK